LVNDDGSTMMMHKWRHPYPTMTTRLCCQVHTKWKQQLTPFHMACLYKSACMRVWRMSRGGPEYIRLPISGLVRWHTCATLWFISGNGNRAIRKLSDHVISSTMRNFICWHSLQNVSKAIEKHDSAKSTINNGIGINLSTSPKM
jgi:hypothetical protein